VDAGLAVDPVRAAWEKVLAGHRLRRLVVTHYHPDHMGLAHWLEERTGAPLWMAQAEYATAQLFLHQVGSYSVAAMLAAFRAHGLPEARLHQLERQGNSYKLGVPAIPATCRPIFDGEQLPIGEQRWQVISGHGHSPEHASLACAQLAVLISGDMLLPRISTNISSLAATPELDPLGLFLASLERLRQLPEDTLVLPSHGLPFRGLHRRIEALRLHHASRCDILLAACARTPRHAAELIPALFDRDITETFQTLFAMGECIAHLVHLEQKGELVRSQEAGIFRFKKP
jgi:glyoxylase-like metal-dependent hydrolase (beta-lactamase superfamily II)